MMARLGHRVAEECHQISVTVESVLFIQLIMVSLLYNKNNICGFHPTFARAVLYMVFALFLALFWLMVVLFLVKSDVMYM